MYRDFKGAGTDNPFRYRINTLFSVDQVTLLEEYANQRTSGNKVDAARELLNDAIQKWQEEKSTGTLSPSAKIAAARFKQERAGRTRRMLIEYAATEDCDELEFRALCMDIGLDPEEIKDAAMIERENRAQRQKRLTRDKCGDFLRGMLRVTSEDGLEINQIVRLAKPEGFSRRQIERSLKDIGGAQYWKASKSFWRLRD